MSYAPLEPVPRPSRVRHAVVLATMLSAVLLYLDRVCISLAGTYIQQDLGLSDAEISWVLGLFFWSYALGQVPSGWLTDRYGARRMLTLYIVAWSAMTALTGLAFGVVSLVAIRLAFGLAQAGAYPTSASVISKWVPFTNRGLASGMVAVGGRIGGAIAPILTALLIVVFVPVSADSTLEPDDVLDPAKLAYALRDRSDETLEQADDDPPAADEPDTARIAEAMQSYLPGARPTIRRLAGEYERALDERRAGATAAGKEPDTVSVSLRPDADDRRRLARAINAMLPRPDVIPADAFPRQILPQQARSLLEEQKTRYLSPEEQMRLNRLLLEKTFPKTLREVYTAGWRPVMFCYGLAGLLVAYFFWRVFRDTPREHPRVNEEEVRLIEYGRPPSASRVSGAVGAVPWLALIKSRSLWLSAFSQWCTNVGWIFLITWLPFYLDEELRVPIEYRGWFQFTPLLVGWFGMLAGGRLTDWMTRRLGLRWGRSLPWALTRFLAMSAYLLLLAVEPSWTLAVVAFSVVAFGTDMGTASAWAFSQDVGGRYVGSVLGWGNMWGNLGAGVATPFLRWIVGEGNWDAAFITCAIAFFLAGVAALGIDASVPVVEEPVEGLAEE